MLFAAASGTLMDLLSAQPLHHGVQPQPLIRPVTPRPVTRSAAGEEKQRGSSSVFLPFPPTHLSDQSLRESEGVRTLCF